MLRVVQGPAWHTHNTQTEWLFKLDSLGALLVSLLSQPCPLQQNLWAHADHDLNAQWPSDCGSGDSCQEAGSQGLPRRALEMESHLGYCGPVPSPQLTGSRETPDQVEPVRSL